MQKEDKVNHFEELWKTIDEFPNYEVSNIARVRNKITGLIKIPSLGKEVILFYLLVKMVGNMLELYIECLLLHGFRIQKIKEKLIILMVINVIVLLITQNG